MVFESEQVLLVFTVQLIVVQNQKYKGQYTTQPVETSGNFSSNTNPTLGRDLQYLCSGVAGCCLSGEIPVEVLASGIEVTIEKVGS